MALCQIRMTNFEDAVSSLTAVLVYAPACAQAYYLRGKAFQCLNEYAMAVGDLEKAQALAGSKHMVDYCKELIGDLQMVMRHFE